MKQNKFIPELRFPGFEGEWEEKKLREISSSYSGGTPVTTKKEFYGGSIPFIRSAEINKETTELFLTQEGLNKSSAKIVNKGNVLFALYGANSGDVAISKIDGAINQAVLCLRTDYSNLYIYHFLTSRKDWIISKYIQGGQGNLSGEIVKSILIPFPSKLEQQKIADCLSSLDTVIDGHNKRLELLQEHKKGLMQQLFPQEGEKLPRLRFPEFKGKWEKKRLGNLATLIKDRVGKRDVTLFSIDAERGLISQIEKFGRIIAGKSVSNYILIQRGDFAYNKSSTKAYPQGQIALLETHEEGAVPNSIFTCFRFNQELIKSEYAKYLFINNIHGKWLRDFIEIGARAHGSLAINNSDLLNLPVAYSRNISEQKKIADCLSSLDNLIEAERRRIEQLQLHKKGLMQKLFPVIND